MAVQQEGIQMILNQVAADGFSKVVWVNLREVRSRSLWLCVSTLTAQSQRLSACDFVLMQEPVIYVDGRPYTVRRTAKLNENDLVPGITRHKVQVLETSMKSSLREQLTLSKRQFEYWHEYELHQNELLSAQVDPDRVFTLNELFESDDVQHANAQIESVAYYRIPIERENAPEHADVEMIMELINTAAPIVHSATYDTAFIFNCQMGKRRTTTALVLAQLIWQRPHVDISNLEPEAPSTTTTDAESTESAMTAPPSNANGNFAVIREVQQQLEFGPQAKQWVDRTIDACAAIFNIRSVIHEFHELSQAEAKPAKRSYYLVRLVSLSAGRWLVARGRFD